jgi:hypothetical protein
MAQSARLRREPPRGKAIRADGQVAHVLEAVLADRVMAIDHKPRPAWALIQARPYHLCERPHTY